MQERILFVDDDQHILEAYQRKLQHVLRVFTAQGPHRGLVEVLEKGPFAVVVADMNMPLMNGIEFLKKVREIAPDTVRMMLTGNLDVKTAMDAVNEGAVFRFLTKPCPSKLMGDSIAAAVRQYRLIMTEKEVLEGTLNGTAELLTEVLSWTSPEAFGRSIQLRNAVKILAAAMKTENSWEIELAATLCQIGFLAIPPEILTKSAAGELLSEEQRSTLESVPAVGSELLSRIPRLENAAKIILYQNKCFDGDGFPPDGVAGQDIPLGGRILKVVGDYQALRASGLSRRESIDVMVEHDTWYDSTVLFAFKRTAVPVGVHPERTQSISLPLKALGLGNTLSSPIMTTEGRMLVAAGTVVTEALLVRLRKYDATGAIKEPIDVVVHGQPG